MNCAAHGHAVGKRSRCRPERLTITAPMAISCVRKVRFSQRRPVLRRRTRPDRRGTKRARRRRPNHHPQLFGTLRHRRHQPRRPDQLRRSHASDRSALLTRYHRPGHGAPLGGGFDSRASRRVTRPLGVHARSGARRQASGWGNCLASPPGPRRSFGCWRSAGCSGLALHRLGRRPQVHAVPVNTPS